MPLSMPLSRPTPLLLSLSLVALVLMTVVAPSAQEAAPAAAPAPSAELRGLWVTRSWMTSPQRVAQVVDDAARHGMSAIFVQVRGRGDAFYAGGPDPRAVLLAPQPAGFDPLAELTRRAGARGLEVHAWVNVNLVAGSTDLPKAPSHVIRRHPEWLMVPRELAPSLLALDPSSPAYVSRLAAWSQRQVHRVEGLYTSPIPEAAQQYVVDVVGHLARQYPLDGVHLDYIRYPAADYDYSRVALDAFRASVVPDLSAADVARFDARLRREPLIYTDAFPQRWLAFRQARLTTLVERVRAEVLAARPGARITTAVWPDADDAVGRKMQDWPGWLRAGLIDAVCPMMYTTSATVFTRQLQELARQPRGTVWPGIGVYRISSAEAARRVAEARDAGFTGVMLFSYDSMTGGVGRPSAYLTALQRAAFRQTPAAVESASAH
jgi:uncharacterized lipoprotein YddW (UPF0748 family)